MEYVERQHIDIVKWNACIDASPNGLLYGRSFYLDHMAKNWNALVLGDYEAIMPLTWNRKYGIKYLYQPPFTQQLGIFSTNLINEQIINAFISELKNHFSFAEIFLNYGNRHALFQPRPNFILSLENNYDEIRNRYKNVLQKNLKRASNAGLHYQKIGEVERVVNLYRSHYGDRFSHVDGEDYERFIKLCHFLDTKKSLILRGAFDGNNSLLACVLLLKDKNRLHLIQSVTLEEGRTAQSNHFLLDNVIREFSGTSLILDFEGSAIPGVADFYQSFGSTEEPYYFLRYNRLPWPLRLLK